MKIQVSQVRAKDDELKEVKSKVSKFTCPFLLRVVMDGRSNSKIKF